MVRTKASQLQRDLTIFTGGFEVLKLNNKKISLESDGIDVPKYTFKIIKDFTTNEGIAFVTLNNPFATSVTNLPCSDICNDFGWDWKDRKIFSKGFTICCSTSDLMNTINEIPEDAKSINILDK